jgi:hypothetical protein
MSDKIEQSGTVKEIMDEQTFGTFTKREFVIEDTTGKFPKDYLFQCTKDRIAMVGELSVGQQVTVHFDIYCSNKNSTGRYFTNLSAWKIDAGEQGNAVPVGAGPDGVDEDLGEPLPF